MSPKKRRAAGVQGLHPSEQKELLTRLAKRRGAVGEAFREELERIVAKVDPDDVAGEVQVTLELIDVDTILDRAGEDRYGYTAPHEAAAEVLGEALDPYLERMRWYHASGRLEAYDAYTIGILRGLYDFEHECEAAWPEWAPDDVRETFSQVLDEWKRRRKGAIEQAMMRDRLAEGCPGWERGLV